MSKIKISQSKTEGLHYHLRKCPHFISIDFPLIRENPSGKPGIQNINQAIFKYHLRCDCQIWFLFNSVFIIDKREKLQKKAKIYVPFRLLDHLPIYLKNRKFLQSKIF